MAPFTLFVWVLTCAIWSTVWLFIKLGVRDVPPVAFAVFRMSVALAVLIPATLIRGTPLPRTRAEWLLIASTGFVLLGVNYALLNWGIQFISSGLTAVLQATTPVFGFVFAHLLLRDEKMTVWKGLALAVGVAGVGIIFRDQLGAPQSRALAGSIAVTAGAACVAIAYVVMKRQGTELHPSVITSGQLVSAVIPLAIYSAIVEGPPLSLPWTRTAILSGRLPGSARVGGRGVAQLLAPQTHRRHQAAQHGPDRAPDCGATRRRSSSTERLTAQDGRIGGIWVIA